MKNYLKLCDITHFYAPESGGVKTYIDKKFEYFKGNPLFKHFLILPHKETKIYTEGRSTKYFVKSPIVPFWKPYRLIINRNLVKKILFREKPDLIEVGSPYLLPKWICKISKSLNFKTVAFFHANIEESFKSVIKTENAKVTTLIRNFILKEYKDFELVITPSKYVENYLKEIGIKQVTTVYLGIEKDIFHPEKKDPLFKRKLNIDSEKTVLIYTGRLSKDKNIFKLAEIFNSLQRAYPNKYHLVIVGSGPEENKLKKELKSNVTFLGYVKSKEELSRIYSSCDVFVTPSRAETFGLAVIEAQASGLPVVAFSSASLPEVTVYKELLANSKEEFCKKILTAEKLSKKLEVRKSLSVQTKSKFSWEKTFKRIEEIYLNLTLEKEEIAC